MSRALQSAVEKQSPEPSGVSRWFQTDERKKEIHQEYLESFRSNVLSALIDMNDVIPCYGQVNFDADPDDRAVLELVRYTGENQYEPVETGVFINSVIEKNRAYYGLE